MNGATEATLQELLAVAQSTNVNIAKMSKIFTDAEKAGYFKHTGIAGAGAGGAIGGAAGAMTGLTKSITPVGVAFKALEGAVSLVSSIFGGLVSIVGKVIGGLFDTLGNLFDFSIAAAKGTAKLSDFINAFRDLPIIGGLFGMFAKIVEYQETLLVSYQRISKSGAAFGGSLMEMAHQAARSYLSLDEFSEIIEKNSDALAIGFGSVQQGLDKFVDAQNLLMSPNGKFGRSLAGLGVNAKESAEVLALYTRMQMASGGLQNKSAEDLAQSTAGLIEEMDLMAQLQGISRKQQEDEMKKVADDALFQMNLDSQYNDAQRTAINAIVASQANALGEGGRSIKMAFATAGQILVGSSEESAQAAIMTSNRMIDANAMAVEIVKKNPGITMAEVEKIIIKMNRMTAEGTNNLQKGNNISLMAMNQTAQATAAYSNSIKFRNMTEKQQAEYIANLHKNQENQANGSAAALEQGEKAVRQFGSTILGVIGTALEPFMTDVTKMAMRMVTGISELLNDPSFKNAMKELGTWLHKTFDSFKTAFNEKGWQGVKDQLIVTFKEIWKEIKPIVVDMFSELFRAMWEGIKDALGINQFARTKEQGKAEDELRKEGKIKGVAFSKEDQEKELKLINERILENQKASKEKKRKERDDLNNFKIGTTQDTEDAEAGKAAATEAPKRHSGTIGMTGNWFEPKNATVELQKGETVATPGQIQQIIDASMKIGSSGGNNSSAELQQLNSLVAQLLSVMKENADSTRRVHDATRALNGNLYLA
jgi:hypothetical protein